MALIRISRASRVVSIVPAIVIAAPLVLAPATALAIARNGSPSATPRARRCG